MEASKARTWTEKLAADLVRVNRTIQAQEQEVNEGIDRLKLLEKEREDIITKTLGGD